MIEQPNWQPSLNEQQTRQVITAYNRNPQAYITSKDSITNHANYYNIPFYGGDFSLLESIKQAGAGFVEGFTTFNVAEHPDNQYEGLARSMGHLIGFAPGILAGPLSKVAQLTGRAGFASAAKAISGFKGAPLYAASKWITPRAAKVAKEASKSATYERLATNNVALKFLKS